MMLVALGANMKITPEQRQSWAEKTARSPFNRWLADQVRGTDGRFDLDLLHDLAMEHGIDKRAEYEGLNPGQQRMNLGNALRKVVLPTVFASYEVEEPALPPQVFGTRFWGFDPTTNPFAGFTHEGSRSNLIKKARPGDLIAVVGTTSEPTAEEDRGKLLGLIEFQRTAMQAEDLIPAGAQLPDRLFENGRFKWPYAVPAVRAWRFDPPRSIRDVINRQLTMAATTSVDRLSDEEAEAVLALSVVEIELPPSRAQLRDERLNPTFRPKLSIGASGQPGPAPSEWSAVTSRCDGPTVTYLMQFGEEPVWKIGISQNPAQRRDSLNFSVPSEVLDGRCWKLVMTHTWPNGLAAYAMEQAILGRLAGCATANERVKASKGLVDSAWQEYLMGRL